MDLSYGVKMSYRVGYTCLCTDMHYHTVSANSDKWDIDLSDMVVLGDGSLVQIYLPYWSDFSSTEAAGHSAREVSNL